MKKFFVLNLSWLIIFLSCSKEELCYNDKACEAIKIEYTPGSLKIRNTSRSDLEIQSYNITYYKFYPDPMFPWGDVKSCSSQETFTIGKRNSKTFTAENVCPNNQILSDSIVNVADSITLNIFYKFSNCEEQNVCSYRGLTLN